MDNACLGEVYVRNGVDASLRKDIAAAIREAVKEEREAIFAEYNSRTGDDLGYFVKSNEDSRET